MPPSPASYAYEQARNLHVPKSGRCRNFIYPLYHSTMYVHDVVWCPCKPQEKQLKSQILSQGGRGIFKRCRYSGLCFRAPIGCRMSWRSRDTDDIEPRFWCIEGRPRGRLRWALRLWLVIPFKYNKIKTIECCLIVAAAAGLKIYRFWLKHSHSRHNISTIT